MESVKRLRRRCGEVVRAALPPSPRFAGIDPDSVTEALLSSLRFRLFEDVRPALVRLSRGGRRLVVVSNWDASLHAVLARLGVAELLDGIITSAEAGERKPAPGIFERALAAAGVDRSRALHVGDSLEEDVVGARAARIEPVLVRRDGSAGPAGVATIASLAELS